MKLVYGRDYDVESERQKGVEEFYRLQHINQTYDFVSKPICWIVFTNTYMDFHFQTRNDNAD